MALTLVSLNTLCVVLSLLTNHDCLVVEATGSVKLLEDAINYCRRGGTLVVYG